MTIENRAFALDQAVKVCIAGGKHDAVIATAAAYAAFIEGNDAAVAPAAKAPAAANTSMPKPATTKPEIIGQNKPKPAAAPAAAKPATAKPAPAKSAEPTGEEAAAAATLAEGGPTQEDVLAAITNLIDNGKRAEAVALLNERGAASVSKLDASHYSDVIAAAETILLTG